VDIPDLPKKCPAIILAGGLGTRLRSAYDRGPKCMAPVGGLPFLEYLLLWLQSAGVQELILCVGYKRSQIQNWLGEGSRLGVNVTYSGEKKLLGTAGALKHAQHLVTAESFFVLNGDSFLSVDLGEMYRYHMLRRALATVAVVQQPRSARYGTVQVDRYGRIEAFREKNSDLGLMNGNDFQLINGGVYIMQREFLELIPCDKAASLEKEVFPSLVGTTLYGFVTNSYFIDIGIPADFERAQSELPERFTA